MAAIKRHPVVFLDRDGTLIHDRPGFFVKRPEQVRIYPYAFKALKLLKAAGYKLVILTNQSGLARGFFDLPMLGRIHHKLLSEFKRRGVRIDGIYFCPHGPESRCACRKPKTPLARRAIRDLHLSLKDAAIIGDKRADIDLGRNLGITSIFIRTGHGRNEIKKYGKNLRPTHSAGNLLAAVRWFLNIRLKT
jgi:histidinol-phosphate phosphatase family protein